MTFYEGVLQQMFYKRCSTRVVLRELFYKRKEYSRIDGLIKARLPEIRIPSGGICAQHPAAKSLAHRHLRDRGGVWRIFFFSIWKKR